MYSGPLINGMGFHHRVDIWLGIKSTIVLEGIERKVDSLGQQWLCKYRHFDKKSLMFKNTCIGRCLGSR